MKCKDCRSSELKPRRIPPASAIVHVLDERAAPLETLFLFDISGFHQLSQMCSQISIGCLDRLLQLGEGDPLICKYAPSSDIFTPPLSPRCVTLCPLVLSHRHTESEFMREVISTKDAPQAIGPYSQAIKANGFIFVSGQVAIDPATQQVIAGDVTAQTDRVLRNLSAILEAAGSGLAKVVRATVFLKNMSEFAAMNEVYGKYLSAAPPARSTVEVARLPKDVLVEIDVIALA